MSEGYGKIEQTIEKKADDLAMERYGCLLEKLPQEQAIALEEEAGMWVAENVDFTNEEIFG